MITRETRGQIPTAAATQSRRERVARLKRLIERGLYLVDADALAREMLHASERRLLVN